MAFHCMNCNGSMIFDVASQKMRCQHCGSECEPDDFVFRDESPEAGGQAFVADGQMAVYSCQNCGAALEGTEESMIGFCPYCGGQSMVMSARGGSDVERIVPFQVPKERCTELYEEYTKKIPYLPKAFRSSEHIKKFTGIYMPFYQYDADFGEVRLTGSKTVESNSRYDVINHYRIDAKVSGSYERGVSFDASRYLDDQVSEDVQPFTPEHERAFHPAYLSGFYADASTVPGELYYADARDRAEEDLIDAMSEDLNRATGIRVDSTSSAEATVTGHHLALMPMWFLTWRKEDRVAYAVVNGEDGTIVSDMPLDLRAFAVGCAIASAAIFVILELLFQPTPMITSFISLATALCMAIGIQYGARREYEHHTHANDKGWSVEMFDDVNDGDAEAKPRKKRRRKSTTKSLKDRGWRFILFAVIWVAIFGGGLLGSMATALSRGSFVRWLIPIPVLAYAIVVGVRVIKWRKEVKWNEPLFAIGVLLVAIIINALVVFIAPVNDGWYYIGDAVCILGLVLSSIGMLRAYNISTTRPLPKLFDRAEV